MKKHPIYDQTTVYPTQYTMAASYQTPTALLVVWK